MRHISCFLEILHVDIYSKIEKITVTEFLGRKVFLLKLKVSVQK